MIRPGQESLDRTLDLPEAFRKLLLRHTVRVRDVVSQFVVRCRERIRVKERKQVDFRNMRRIGPSQEDGLAMLHHEDHVAFLDHVFRDRLRSMTQQVDSHALRYMDGEIRRWKGCPDFQARRAGTDSTQIPVSRDLPEIPPCIRTPADISLAYKEKGLWKKWERRVLDPFPLETPVQSGHPGPDPAVRPPREQERLSHGSRCS